MTHPPELEEAWQRLDALNPNPAIRQAVAELLDAVGAVSEPEEAA